MDERFLRTRMLLGGDAMERLSNAHVCVLGLGGVGSWCAEALARSGVGELTLMDQDTVEVSNLNRQAEALESTLGLPKAEAMAQRVLAVNPACRVHPVQGRYEADSREAFFAARYDYIVDAIDLVSCKLDLIETALGRQMEAVAQDRLGAALQGININRVSATVCAIGCALAAIAGCFMGAYQGLSANMGDTMNLRILMLVMLAGAGSMNGIIITGTVMGFLDCVCPMLFQGNAGSAVPIAIVVILLLIKPKGFFGHEMA